MLCTNIFAEKVEKTRSAPTDDIDFIKIYLSLQRKKFHIPTEPFVSGGC
jgi:hypothetical protein